MTEGLNRIVVVVGASGFVGSAVADSLERAGSLVRRVSAPRMISSATSVDQVVAEALSGDSPMAPVFVGASVVVNAAGLAQPSGSNPELLVGANSVLPVALQRAAQDAGVERFVHVSSASVQGTGTLDESERMQPFSTYSWSKALGESALRSCGQGISFRATSVQGVGRATTRRIARLARSPLSVVAAPGNQPTPQALIENVADAVALVATVESAPPSIVLYPWEGLTTSQFLNIMGGHYPRLLPSVVHKAAHRPSGATVGRWPRVAATRRRAELLLLGQRQLPGYLDALGWQPRSGLDAWRELARRLDQEGR